MYHNRTGRPVPLPSVSVGGYLLDAFRELGYATPTPSGGMVALSFSEIRAAFDWADERERLVLKNMSRAYLRGWNTGRDVLGIEPWESHDG